MYFEYTIISRMKANFIYIPHKYMYDIKTDIS
jgi:hypothetical protein